jgi:SAM-dependent methyltransferase
LPSFKFTSATLSYAEAAYEALGDTLFRLVKNHGLRTESSINRFVDLGSGGGKAVFAAYFTGLFFSCTGIELLPRLHKASKQYLRFFKRQILTHDEADELTAEKKINFVQGDFTYLDWSSGVAASSESRMFHEGDNSQEEDVVVVFAMATSFDFAMRRRVSLTANRLPAGSFFVCTTHKYGHGCAYNFLHCY